MENLEIRCCVSMFFYDKEAVLVQTFRLKQFLGKESKDDTFWEGVPKM